MTTTMWEQLKAGDRIKVGWQECATVGTFVGLARTDPESDWLYGDGGQTVVRYVNEHGREDGFVPHVEERPRPVGVTA